MKTALITTTINIPGVLALYRRFDPGASVRFFCAIDTKTPRGIRQFLDNLGNCECIEATDYKCDQIIGWNSIQRRNLALLEALRWGADIIVSTDDDNIPIDPNYFIQFERLLDGFNHPLFSGLQACGDWFDVGQFLQPPAIHRGFPVEIMPNTFLDHSIDARIGVAAGMVLGDPDTSAVERIARSPRVSGVAEILKSGLVVDPTTKTVFNSQNTGFIRELGPAMMMWPGVGRYDDIFASLLCQRVMRDRGLMVHFGRPFVYQQRNNHDLVNDLKQELFGMEHLVRFAEWLDQRIFLEGDSILGNVQDIYFQMGNGPDRLDWMPPVVSQCGMAWCEDIERVMG